MATIHLFFTLREAAGESSAEIAAETLDALLASANLRYGPRFAARLAAARVWVNDDLIVGPISEVRLTESDNVVLLPPVSGG